MQQFVVEKANRVGEGSWSTRVLTVDAANHILYLSQHDEASTVNHHCMVKIKKVEWWPHYNCLTHSTAYFLGDSELTFCLKGSCFNVGATSSIKRIFHPRTRRITGLERSALESSYALAGSDMAVAASPCPEQVYVCDAWVLRCMTREDIEPLLAALRSAVVDPKCVRGTIHAPRSWQHRNEEAGDEVPDNAGQYSLRA